MGKHSQRPDRKYKVCLACQSGNCEGCVDVLRALFADDLICECTRPRHGGEPLQIQDPETSVVYSGCAEVHPDGKVIFNHRNAVQVSQVEGQPMYHCPDCGQTYKFDPESGKGRYTP